MNYIQIIDVFFISGFTAYLLTPFVKKMAIKSGYLDHPKNNKVHAHPTPLLGGVSIFVAFLVALLTKAPVISAPAVSGLLLGASILFVIGLIDDKMGMMPEFKLLGQFLAAMVLIKSGVRIECIHNYYVSILVTYFWIIGVTNGFNLLDNMNGLSAGIAAIAAIFFGIISFISGQHVISAVSFAVAGSALGFLKYNFPKADIFMGDAGSLVLGYILSAIAIMGSWETYIMTTSIAVPILVLGYPIFDTALVSIIRVLEGRSIFQGGKDHSSHRLALLGLKRFKTVLFIYCICIFLGFVALLVTKVHWKTGIALVFVAVATMTGFGVRLSFVDTKRFGRRKATRED
ncbi:MAG: undecaprenyl/decaprenyl-phosphate alpha-N-acetylglucosaminyl 1-phosphate transferase [Candidatus Omnitrophica bacterium]|nr:undecaprenyl/decaprenyl-phosphate alpha-N-acetylglucosaminyl 1-phosphate transferase [Candidatus Omnitrophota bacterium]